MSAVEDGGGTSPPIHGKISVDGRLLPFMKIKEKEDNERRRTEKGDNEKQVWSLMENEWKVSEPKLIISVTGLAGNLPGENDSILKAAENFKTGLVKAAEVADAWIVTGGTDKGVMKMVGDAIKNIKPDANQSKIIVLGIAVWNKIHNRESLINTENEDSIDYFESNNNNSHSNDEVQLNQHHTHFILVETEKGQFGGEIKFRSDLEKYVAKQRKGIKVPIVLLVFNGGPGTLVTVGEAIDADTHVVVIKESGRVANLISFVADENRKRNPFSRQQISENIVKQYFGTSSMKEEDLKECIQICKRCEAKHELIHVIDLSTEDLSETIISILNKENKEYGKLDMKNLAKWKEFVDKVDFVLDYMAPCDQRSVPGDQIIVEEELQKLKPEDHIFVNEAHYVLKNLPPKLKGTYAFGRMKDSSPYIKIDVDDEPEPAERTKKLASNVRELMIQHWNVPEPRLIISVTGGAGSFSMNKTLGDNFKKGLVEAAEAADAWIISGGTHSGIMKKVGNAAAKHQRKKMVIIGIAAWGPIKDKTALTNRNIFHNFHKKDVVDSMKGTEVKEVTEETKPKTQNLPKSESNPDVTEVEEVTDVKDVTETPQNLPKSETPNPDVKKVAKSEPNPNHTHFVFVDNSKNDGFGGEIKFRAILEKTISEKAEGKVPIVLLVLEGGGNTLQTAAEAMKNKTPVVVIAGSGRAADFIAHVADLVSWPKFTPTRKLTPSEKDKLEPEVKKLISAPEQKEQCFKYVEYLLDEKCSSLLTIFHEEVIEHSKSISTVIFDSIFQAENYTIWDLLRLTLAYNRIDVAKDKIFTYGKLEQIRTDETKKFMIMALKENKHQFVKLFLDHKVIKLKTFLTTDVLTELYQIMDTKIESGQLYKILKHSIKVRDEPHRCPLKFCRINPLKCCCCCGCCCSNKVHPTCETRNTETKKQGGSHKKIEKIRKLIEKMCDSKTKLMVKPHRDLFAWALLMNWMEMTMVFWEAGNENIAASLVASRMLNRMASIANQADEINLYQKLTENADKFEQHAVGVMNVCYDNNIDTARQILKRKLSDWKSEDLLTLANSSQQMNFMDTTCCQTVLTEFWYGGMNFVPRFCPTFIQLLVCLICPFLAITQFKAKKDENKSEEPEKVGRRVSKCQKFLKFFRMTFLFVQSPMAKFWYYTISYLVFLALFSYFLMCDLYPISEQGPGICEILVWVWVFSFVVELVKQFAKSLRSTEQLGSKWNYFELVVTVFFIVSVVLRCTLHGSDFVWARMFYSASLAFYFIKFLRIFYVFERLGPLVIMTQYMLMDVLFFLLILIVFLLAFGITAQALLYPNAEPNWEVLKNVVYQPYFDIYGPVNLDELQGCVPGCSENSTTVDDSACSDTSRCPQKSWLVMVSFAIYMMLINILLINLLIAMFGYTFNRVQSQSLTVWRYHRYELVMEYMDKPFLVPPISIIITIYDLMEFLLCTSCRSCSKTNPSSDSKSYPNAEERLNAEKRLKDFEKERTKEYLQNLQKEENKIKEIKLTLTKLRREEKSKQDQKEKSDS